MPQRKTGIGKERMASRIYKVTLPILKRPIEDEGFGVSSLEEFDWNLNRLFGCKEVSDFFCPGVEIRDTNPDPANPLLPVLPGIYHNVRSDEEIRASSEGRAGQDGGIDPPRAGVFFLEDSADPGSPFLCLGQRCKGIPSFIKVHHFHFNFRRTVFQKGIRHIERQGMGRLTLDSPAPPPSLFGKGTFRRQKLDSFFMIHLSEINPDPLGVLKMIRT
jgi:hypothetical protein